MKKVLFLIFCLSIIYFLPLKKYKTTYLNSGKIYLYQGYRLSKVYCSSCHIRPKPESFLAEDWEYLFSYMGLLVGRIHESHNLSDLEKQSIYKKIQILRELNKIPPKSTIDDSKWKVIKNYYRYYSKSKVSTLKKLPETKLFQLQDKPTFRVNDPAITLIQKLGDKIAFGLGWQGKLLITTKSGKETALIDTSGPPVSLIKHQNKYYLTTIGDLLGNRPNESLGHIDILSNNKIIPYLSNLSRPISILAVNDKSFLLASFGLYNSSGLSLVSQNKKTSILKNLAVLKIINNPYKKNSWLFLTSDAKEGIHLLNYKDESWTSTTIYNTPPEFGLIDMTFADLENNDKFNLILINGDSADSGPFLSQKSFQGLRIFSYKNQKLKEVFFLPMPGAYSMKVIDIDKNGYKDIIVASFYPYKLSPRLIIVFNYGKQKFVPMKIKVPNYRYTRLELIDLDNDGDQDIILGVSDLKLQYRHQKKSNSLSPLKSNIMVVKNLNNDN